MFRQSFLSYCIVELSLSYIFILYIYLSSFATPPILPLTMSERFGLKYEVFDAKALLYKSLSNFKYPLH